MIKVADKLREVLIDTQKYLQSEGCWNDRVENAWSDIDGFLDHRVKYEAMGWKRIFRYCQMQNQIEQFKEDFLHLEEIARKSQDIHHLKSLADRGRAISLYWGTLGFISLNYWRVYWAMTENKESELESISLASIGSLHYNVADGL